MLWAQFLPAGWTIIGVIIWAIIIAGIIAIAFIACRAMGVPIPPWVIQILWVIFIVVVAVVAIKFLATLL